MKTYSVEIYRSARHGQYGSNYMGIAVYTVEAKNKKEAKEKALDFLIGQKASEFENFPIDMAHAPEAVRESEHCWSMSYEAMQNHIINEYDISQKNTFAVDVTEEKE